MRLAVCRCGAVLFTRRKIRICGSGDKPRTSLLLKTKHYATAFSFLFAIGQLYALEATGAAAPSTTDGRRPPHGMFGSSIRKQDNFSWLPVTAFQDQAP